MATFDISLLNSVSIVIVFMLFFVGGFGVLNLVDPFKNKKIYGILAFLIALVMVMTAKATEVVMTATPWLILIVMLGFFFIFYAKMFGVSDGSITHILTGSAAKGWLITLVVIVVLFSVGTAFGPNLTKLSAPDTSSAPAIDPNEPVFDAQGNIVPAGTISAGTGTAGTGGSGVATGDFSTNLIFTLFNPKVLGLIFMFLLGTLTVLMLNQ